MNIYTNDNAAGGWTGYDSVARRLCTALWHASDAFAKIKRYEADVVLDYEIVLREVAKLEPGQFFVFTYYVHDNGTHFAVLGPAEDVGTANAAYCAHVGSIADNFFNEEYSFYTGYVRRAEIRTAEWQTWDPHTYALSIDAHVARRDHERVVAPETSLPIEVAQQS